MACVRQIAHRTVKTAPSASPRRVARLGPHKGTDLLIKAVAALRDSGRSSTFALDLYGAPLTRLIGKSSSISSTYARR